VCVAIFALFVMGAWIEYVEKYSTYGGPLAENSPPNAAVGVILLVMGISVALYGIRRPLRLSPRELVVVYAALVFAAPLMTQGLWGRLFGLLAGIPNTQNFKAYDSLPSMLWPHGPNRVENPRFKDDLKGYAHTGGGTVGWEAVDRGRRGVWRSPVLSNGTNAGARAALSFTLPRFRAGREIIVPGERFLFSALVKAEGLQKDSSYFVTAQADTNPVRTILVATADTQPTFANPCGFQRVGATPVAVPNSLREALTLSIGIAGPGRLTVQDLQFLNIEAVEGLYSGRDVVREGHLDTLDAGERNFTLVKPDRMFSPAGLRYLLTGYLPLRQWVMPATAWTALIGGLFAGFLGLNLLMRKQWAEHERFAFPLTIVPRNLFTEEEADGRVRFTLFRNRFMWIGFACTLPLVLLKGFHFYNPSVPAPMIEGGSISFASYVTSPLLRIYLERVGIGIATGIGLPFCLIAIALLIETNILFSLWAFYLLFQLWNVFGALFRLNHIPGYPWAHQQAMGSFLAYALIALVVARRHLREVVRRVFGLRRGGGGMGAEAEARMYRVAILMVAASLVLLAAWGLWTEMGLTASLLFFGYMLVLGFATSKIRAECGAPFAYLTPYYGMQFVAAVGGFAVFGSKGMLVASMASGFMTTSCFLLAVPVQVEMMELGRHFGVRLRDTGAGLTLGLLGGLFIGGFTVLSWAYGIGANNLETSWPYRQDWYYGSYTIAEMNADHAWEAGTLNSAPETRPLNPVTNPDARGLAIGAAVTAALAFLRTRFAGFPLHPLGYVLAPTFFMMTAWFAMFVAWVIRTLMLKVGGAQMIRRGLVPFAVGMFLACIASVVLFDVVGILLRLQGITRIYSGIP
jgi:hypothetical protein